MFHKKEPVVHKKEMEGWDTDGTCPKCPADCPPMETPDNVQIIGHVAKNLVESIQVELCDWRGQTYVDVRVYTEAGKPTAKGITMRPRACRDLLPLLQRALDELSARSES
jgi:C4-type Zn-finger protein